MRSDRRRGEAQGEGLSSPIDDVPTLMIPRQSFSIAEENGRHDFVFPERVWKRGTKKPYPYVYETEQPVSLRRVNDPGSRRRR